MPELTARRRLSQRPAQGPQGESASAMAFLAAIGREVRRQRAKRGMTRRQLAQASETSERYLAQIESGAGNPSVSVLRAIAQALDLPAAALLPDAGGPGAALGASSISSRRCRRANGPRSRR
jgi:transcriptional regulator with XRE-family HTH domain